jgi:hypothetical protein
VKVAKQKEMQAEINVRMTINLQEMEADEKETKKI